MLQAVRSILDQDFTDLELIVSDDTAGGAVRSALAVLDDARLAVLEGPRQGQVPNTRFLWEQARGELIKYVHDDDYLLPGALEALVGAIDQFPEASLAWIRRKQLSPNGELTGDAPEGAAKRVSTSTLLSMCFEQLHNFVGEPTCSILRRDSLTPEEIEAYRGFRVRHLVDFLMYLAALERGPAVAVFRYLAVARLHPEQATWAGPDRSAGYFEWELFLRGELVRGGRISLQAALGCIERLRRAYNRYAPEFPELAVLAPGLDELEAELERGRGDPLGDAFQARWREAAEVLEARLARRPPREDR